MNSLLRIQVRVNAKAANANLAALSTQLDALAASAARVSASTKGLNLVGMSARSSVAPLNAQNTAIKRVNKSLQFNNQLSRSHAGAIGMLNTAINGASTAATKGLLGMSKNLQWIGRQLNFNFTIPLGIAAGAATKWALDVERAFTRVRKVYGDNPEMDYTAELDKIARGTRLLSDYFGVAQDEVNLLAADFAAAGAEGGALLKSVETGLQLQILGDYESPQDAFSGLLTIQKAFRLSVEETAGVIALLNTVENRTAASLPGLVEGIEKAGGMAAAAGVDFRQLAAAIAAMTPTAGGPEEIGTSLKTIFSRIVDSTGEIQESFDAIGFDVQGMLNDGKDAMEILEAMAWATAELTDSERARLGSVFGGRRQANRVLALWDDIIDKQSTYYQVLDDLDPANDLKSIAQAQKEIDTLLDSDPRKLQIITEQIKNLAIDAIQPMIPLLIGLVAGVRNLFQWFNELDPAVQKYIATGLIAVAVTGMLAQFIGSLGLLFGTLANFILKPILWMKVLVGGVAKLLGPIAMMLGRFLVSPWGLALAAIIAAVALFNDDLRNVFSSMWRFIVEGFNKLPESIANAMRAVVDVLARAASAIANFFGGIFGVQTEAGVNTNIPKPNVTGPIPVQYHTGGIVQGTGDVPAVLQAGEMVLTAEQQATLFKLATQNIRDAKKSSDRTSAIATVEGGAPGSGAALSNLFAQLDILEGALQGVGTELEMQQEIVDNLDKTYEAASKAVDDFEKSMKPLEEKIDALNDTISTAEQTIQGLANAPIEGMGAMSDAIFENELATKKLRLELLKLEDAGQTYENIKSRISAINGDIEMIRAKMTSLREAGAGSEILSVYQDQLDALEGQKDALREQGDEASKIEDELKNLERAGQILQLQQDITFDPLVRQIQQMVDGVEEMSFDEIVAQIQEQQAILSSANEELAAAEASYEEQVATLDILKAREEEIGELRDVEQQKLNDIKDTYDEIKTAISDIESLINDTISAQEALTSAAVGGSGGAGIGGGLGAGGDFDDPVLPDAIFDFDQDLDSMIADLEKAIQDAWGDWDVFGPLKEKWEDFKTDMSNLWRNFQGWMQSGWDTVSGWWNGISIGEGPFSKLGEIIDGIVASPIWTTFGNVAATLGNTLKKVGQDMAAYFSPVLDDLWEFAQSAGQTIVSVFNLLAGVLGLLSSTLNFLWPVLDPVIEAFGRLFALVVATPVVAAIQGIVNVLTIVMDVLRGVSELIQGDFSAAWDAFKGALDGLLDLVTDPLNQIKDFVLGFADIIWDAAEGVGGALMDGLTAGISKLLETFWQFITDIPLNIITRIKEALGIASPSTVMMEIGENIVQGLWDGMVAMMEAFLLFVAGIPLAILGYFVDGLTLLAPAGEDILKGLKSGAETGWAAIKGWFIDIPVKIIRAIGELIPSADALKTAGQLFVGGIKTGAEAIWETISGFFASLPGKLVSAVMNAPGSLFNAGWNLIISFKNGLKGAWNSVANWWNGKIGNWGLSIPDWVPGWLGGGQKISVPDMPVIAHTGGIITGMGNVPAVLQAGEMVLTRSQQAQLFNMANGSSMVSSSGTRNITFTGDLSFPNVTNGEDAEEFISNLEALAGAT